MGTRGRWGVVAAAVATTLLLSGCAEARVAPLSGLSEAELARYQDYSGAKMWEFMGLPENERPDVEIEYVGVEEWSEALATCSDVRDSAEEAGATPQVAITGEYRCRMRYQLRAGDLGLLNEAQLEYLYDYYQDTLVPCLRVHGVEVREVLTRSQAVDIGRFGAYPWNPYGDMSRFTRDDPGDRTIWSECPAFPPDSIFDRYWEP